MGNTRHATPARHPSAASELRQLREAHRLLTLEKDALAGYVRRLVPALAEAIDLLGQLPDGEHPAQSKVDALRETWAPVLAPAPGGAVDAAAAVAVPTSEPATDPLSEPGP